MPFGPSLPAVSLPRLPAGRRLHHIGVGHDWGGTKVIMLIRDLDIRVITEDTGELIRELELDASRDYQPSGRDRYARWRT